MPQEPILSTHYFNSHRGHGLAKHFQNASETSIALTVWGHDESKKTYFCHLSGEISVIRYIYEEILKNRHFKVIGTDFQNQIGFAD